MGDNGMAKPERQRTIEIMKQALDDSRPDDCILLIVDNPGRDDTRILWTEEVTARTSVYLAEKLRRVLPTSRRSAWFIGTLQWLAGRNVKERRSR